MNAGIATSSDDLSFSKAPTRLLGELQDEALHHWLQQFEIARELLAYGVTLKWCDPDEDGGRRLIAECSDPRLRRVAQLATDLVSACGCEKDCKDALQDALIKAGSGQLGNISKKREAENKIDAVAAAWVIWATKGECDEEDFAATLAQRNGGSIDAAPQTIRKYIKRIRSPIVAKVRSLFASRHQEKDVIAKTCGALQGQRGVSEATVRLVVSNLRNYSISAE